MNTSNSVITILLWPRANQQRRNTERDWCTGAITNPFLRDKKSFIF